jgi:uncharacterized membrane protein YfcA
VSAGLATVAVAVGAFAQSISGIGFALVCGPFLVAILGVREGVRVAVVLSTLLNAVLVVREFHAVRVRDGLRLLIPAALATPLLAVGVRRIDTRWAALAAGVATLIGAGVLASGRRWRRASGPTGAVVAGVISATMNVVAAIGGPAAALYADNAGWRPASTRATLQAYFLALNLVALASLGLPRVSPVLLVGLATGSLLGALVAHRMSEPVVRRATLGLAAFGGLVVVVRSLTSA